MGGRVAAFGPGGYDDATLELIKKEFIPLAGGGYLCEPPFNTSPRILTAGGIALYGLGPDTDRGSYFPKKIAIWEGLKTFKAMSESERKPATAQRLKWPSPLPKPPPNGLILKEHLRTVYRDNSGQVRPTAAEPGADYMWLTEAEVKALLPSDAKKGAKAPFPEPIWRRLFPNQFYHFYLCGHTAPAYDADKAKPSFTLVVDNVTSDQVKMRLEGSAAVRLHCYMGEQVRSETIGDLDFRMLGYIDFDKRSRSFSRFDLAGVGKFQPNPSHTGHRHISGDWEAPAGKSLILGMSFELGSGKSADLAPPKFRQYGEASYFGFKP